jgi:hypothetical protein
MKIQTTRKLASLMAAFLFVMLQHGFCQVGLKSNEEMLFSFKTTSGKTIQIVKDIEDKYIFYRAIKKGKVELEYPEKKEQSWSAFKFTYYFRPNGNDLGMDLNFLEFYHEGYQYVVCLIYYEADATDKVGVRCTDIKTQNFHDVKRIRKTVKGDFRDLYNNEKMRLLEFILEEDSILL